MYYFFLNINILYCCFSFLLIHLHLLRLDHLIMAQKKIRPAISVDGHIVGTDRQMDGTNLTTDDGHIILIIESKWKFGTFKDVVIKIWGIFVKIKRNLISKKHSITSKLYFEIKLNSNSVFFRMYRVLNYFMVYIQYIYRLH